MDIRPPKNYKRPGLSIPKVQNDSALLQPIVSAQEPGELPEIELNLEQPVTHKKRKIRMPVWLSVIFGLLALLVGATLWWYQEQLQPTDRSATDVVRFEVKDGMSFSDTAQQLKDRGLIRAEWAFEFFAWTQGKRGLIKAGTCSLKKSESAAQILNKITEGCHDFKSITFFPGGTIEKPLYKPVGSTLNQVMYIKYVLEKAGFSENEISQALSKQYKSSIFADKPAGTTLEGYVFGETYYIPIDASAEFVLQSTFDQFEKILKNDDLVAKFKAQGLNLYQGITLASIVQRELNCEDKPTAERKDRCYGYQQQIAQVFLTRLKKGMALGSDVTFIYAADMSGVTPSPELDSPYNTRRNAGLPPGPIAVPGELALKAVANPSVTDYLFFIAGDDGLIYFAKTNAEHEANIQAHCKQLCSM